MTSAAPYLPPVPRPPHDPLSWLLDRRAGWRVGSVARAEVSPADGALALVPLPAGFRALAEPSGSFGGLTLPDHVALTPDGQLLLLDRATGLLKQFDRCECRFEVVPCTLGLEETLDPSSECPPARRVPRDPRRLGQPGGIGVACGNLMVCDPGRRCVLAFALPSFSLRGTWAPPASSGLAQPWSPVDVASHPRVGFLVSDPANGALHVFSPGGRWRRAIPGLGAIDSLAVDAAGRVYARVSGQAAVVVLELAGATARRLSEQPIRAEEVAGRFPPPPLVVAPDGALDLSEWCRAACACGEGRFDASGSPVAAPVGSPAPTYPTSGVFVSGPLDSQLYRCVWDRLRIEGRFPPGTRVRIETFTAETAQPLVLVLSPETAWTPGPTLEGTRALTGNGGLASWDGLIRSPGGRYLWLKLSLEGDGRLTPRLCSVRLFFPRISLRRYLPGAFGADPLSADFTDRLLAIFDREFRGIEKELDDQARLFDPLSAPSGGGNPRHDFLTWLAGWIGVALDPTWPEARRRRYLKEVGRLMPLRGTPEALRRHLELYLGLRPAPTSCPRPPQCGPCGVAHPPAGQPPELVLEHFRLRRWLFVGGGRLGDQARLWGERIVNRSRLGGGAGPANAQLGASQLKTSQDPWRDPFHVYAHRFTVFAPARLAGSPAARRSLERLIRAERPAQAAFDVVYVEPRFRVGVQSMIGFDSVVGCWPERTVLGAARLGRATVVSGPPGLRVGREARVGTTTGLA